MGISMCMNVFIADIKLTTKLKQMADFLKAIGSVLTAEGYSENKRTGYTDDPQDRGGETVAGIARNFWPKEPIWGVVDRAKKESGFPKNLSNNPNLHPQVLSFYKTKFWDKVSGDTIKNQSIASLLMDSAVNEGITPAIKRAQSIVGLPATGIADKSLTDKLNSL